jgi:DNA processing protein
MADQRAYWVGFNLVKGIGAVRLRALLEYFGSLAMAWEAPAEALAAAGLSAKIIENLQTTRRQINLENYLMGIDKKGIQVLTWEDQAYPARLKEIEQPPPVLYMRGTLTAEDHWAVAVVGTRRTSSYGKQVAEELGTYLAENGVTVVSGLARGIDSIAHSAAVKAKGRTIAVLGSGVDCIYPPEHQPLAAKIITQGCLLSDYPPGSPPDSINFPARNRIISGLSLATVVVEAGDTSGALITATFAAEQGRDVLAVPGNIFSPQSKGTNRLILQGARPLLVMQDVLEVLNLTQISQHQAARQVLPADATEARLLQILGYDPLYIDEICSQSGLSIEKVSAALAMMELKGMTRQVGGMSYIIIRENQADYDAD